MNGTGKKPMMLKARNKLLTLEARKKIKFKKSFEVPKRFNLRIIEESLQY